MLFNSAGMTKANILVVDGDPKRFRLVKLFLERTSLYKVTEENRSSHALRAARVLQPAAILLDIDMPGKDGAQIAAELKADPQLATCPVLFLTSLVSFEKAGNREVVYGGQPFLAKPVNPIALV